MSTSRMHVSTDGTPVSVRPAAPYAWPHVLDHADQAPRSGPLPRALGAVSNVLTGRPSDLRPLLATSIDSDCVARRARRPANPSGATCPPPPRPPGPPCPPPASTRAGPQLAAALTSRRAGARAAAAPAPARRAARRAGRVFAIGAVAGVQRTPYAWLFRTLVRPRLGPPARAGGRRAAAVRPGRRPRLRARRPRRATSPALTCSGWSPPASRWRPPSSTRVFGFCLGCEVYLLVRRLHRLRHHHPHHHDRPPTRKAHHHEPRHRSRERRLGRGAPRRPTASSSSRSTRTPPPTTRATSGAPSSSTGRPTCRTRSAATSSARQQFEALLSEQGVAQRPHGRAVRRQQQLVRRLRLLVLQALRPPGRQAPRRRPQEVGARLPRADRRAAHPRARRPTPRRSRTPRSAPSATRPSRPSARRTSSTSAAPTSTPAGCSPRPTCRRSRPSAPATSRPRRTSRGARRPTTTAPSSPTTS